MRTTDYDGEHSVFHLPGSWGCLIQHLPAISVADVCYATPRIDGQVSSVEEVAKLRTESLVSKRL